MTRDSRFSRLKDNRNKVTRQCIGAETLCGDPGGGGGGGQALFAINIAPPPKKKKKKKKKFAQSVPAPLYKYETKKTGQNKTDGPDYHGK